MIKTKHKQHREAERKLNDYNTGPSAKKCGQCRRQREQELALLTAVAEDDFQAEESA